MAYKLVLNGVPIEAATVTEVVALAKAIEAERAKRDPPANGKRVRITRPTMRPRAAPELFPVGEAPDDGRFDAVKMLIAFLETIQSGAEQGVLVERILPILEIENPRAIGNRCRVFNELLEERGFKDPIPKVYWSERLGGRKPIRRWYAGPQLAQAIELFRGEVGRAREVAR